MDDWSPRLPFLLDEVTGGVFLEPLANGFE
jgi:hypothetical protein